MEREKKKIETVKIKRQRDRVTVIQIEKKSLFTIICFPDLRGTTTSRRPNTMRRSTLPKLRLIWLMI